MSKIEQIISFLTAPLAEKGYEILQIRYLKESQRRSKLEILLERLDEQPVTLDDCTKASRMIATLLDVEDPISEAYTLEVSSPGLDRPLLRLRDYERFQGHLVKLELKEPFENKKRFKAIIYSIKGECIVFQIEDDAGTAQQLSVDLQEIYHCKLSPLL